VATGDIPSLGFALKISDLASASQLKSLLQSQAMLTFRFASAIAPYWDGPVGKLPEGVKVSFNLSQDGCWKTSTGISFGLTGSATTARASAHTDARRMLSRSMRSVEPNAIATCALAQILA